MGKELSWIRFDSKDAIKISDRSSNQSTLLPRSVNLGNEIEQQTIYRDDKLKTNTNQKIDKIFDK